uniref:Uncharacterized protein n=1 Tax=Arundo donax TaxID=35708 RepID=A0A0A8YAI5_ARUDO
MIADYKNHKTKCVIIHQPMNFLIRRLK